MVAAVFALLAAPVRAVTTGPVPPIAVGTPVT
jgi:hypothetical protein